MNASSRMRYVQPTIEAAQANIGHAPKVVLETAIGKTRERSISLRRGSYDISGETPNVSPLKASCAPAVEALKEIPDVLETER